MYSSIAATLHTRHSWRISLLAAVSPPSSTTSSASTTRSQLTLPPPAPPTATGLNYSRFGVEGDQNWDGIEDFGLIAIATDLAIKIAILQIQALYNLLVSIAFCGSTCTYLRLTLCSSCSEVRSILRLPGRSCSSVSGGPKRGASGDH